jgi:photosynthetic reaction center cytochrome c subunit
LILIAGQLRRVLICVAGAALALGIGIRAEQAPAGQQPAEPSAAPQAPPQGAQGRGGPGFTPPRPPRPGETAGQYYKNIKVLKDIPATDLPPTMQFIAASLGVQCNFCHVTGPQGGFDKDEKKPKETARTMMQMVMDINNHQFEGRQRVGCATCHHGHNTPERTPPLAVEMTPAEAARAAQMRAARGGGPAGPGGAAGIAPGRSEPGPMGAQGRGNAPGRGEGQSAEPPKPSETIDQVVDKYVQALGGRAALESAKTRVMIGTATTRDLQTVPVKIQEKSTGEFRMDLDVRPAPIVRATDGKTIWVQMGQNVRDAEGLQAQQATRLADFTVPLNMKKHYENLTPSRYDNIDGTETILVTGRVSPDINEQLQFDRQSGLLLRRTILTRTAFGNLLEQVDYSDYRDVNSVKVPFQVRYATWNELLTEKFSDVKLNAPVDDAQFARPPRPAPAVH